MPKGFQKGNNINKGTNNGNGFKKGHPNIYGFQKGHIPYGKPFQKGHKRIGNSGARKGCKKPPNAWSFPFGEKHYNWKGGITPFTKQIRGCFKNRQWICDIFQRDDYTCANCGIRGRKLHAHHIKAFSIILKENNISTLEQALSCEELWNINNGIILCEDCHQ